MGIPCLQFSLMLNNTAANSLMISLTCMSPLTPTWQLAPFSQWTCFLSPFQILLSPWIPSQFLIPHPRLSWSGSLPLIPMATSLTTWFSGRGRRKTVSCMSWIIASKVSADGCVGAVGFTHIWSTFRETPLPFHFPVCYKCTRTHTLCSISYENTHTHF